MHRAPSGQLPVRVGRDVDDVHLEIAADQGDVGECVPLANGGLASARDELAECECSDGLQQPKSDRAPVESRGPGHEALVREDADPVEDVRGVGLGMGHHPGRLRDIEAAVEDGQVLQDPLLPRRQQVVAPAYGPIQRALPRWHVARAGSRQRHPAGQPVSDRTNG